VLIGNEVLLGAKTQDFEKCFDKGNDKGNVYAI
jgi:hypothetical protein